MAIKENQLPDLSTMSLLNKVRIVTQGGASSNGTVQLLANTVLTKYPGNWLGTNETVQAAFEHLRYNGYMGQGYGTCSTAAATAAKTASVSDYRLTSGGIITIRFQYAAPANATLNISDTGAYPIYHKNTNITAGIINEGDICTFMFDGSHYVLLNMEHMTTNSTQITLTASGVSSPSTLYKCGKVVMLSIQLGNGTALSSLTGVDTIGTLPEGYRPPAPRIFPIGARNSGAWGSATYYNAMVSIDQDGVISLRGKASDLKQAQYLMGAVTFLT